MCRISRRLRGGHSAQYDTVGIQMSAVLRSSESIPQTIEDARINSLRLFLYYIFTPGAETLSPAAPGAVEISVFKHILALGKINEVDYVAYKGQDTGDERKNAACELGYGRKNKLNSLNNDDDISERNHIVSAKVLCKNAYAHDSQNKNSNCQSVADRCRYTGDHCSTCAEKSTGYGCYKRENRHSKGEFEVFGLIYGSPFQAKESKDQR